MKYTALTAAILLSLALVQGAPNRKKRQTGPCAASPCSNGATCVENGNDVECICPINYAGKFCEYFCYPADVGIVYDCSGSIKQWRWEQLVVPFSKALWGGFTVGPDDTKFGATAFSKIAYPQWNLDGALSTAELDDKVEAIPYTSINSSTCIECGLDSARDHVFGVNNGDRIGKTNICVFFCDGICNTPKINNVNCPNLAQTAQELQVFGPVAGEDTTVLSVVLGTDANMSEMETVASGPDDTGVYQITDFDAMMDYVLNVKEEICKASNPCNSNPCQNGGTCIPQADGSYICECANYWTGTNCESDIDDCPGHDCQNGATCVDGINSFTCECPTTPPPGFIGDKCEYKNLGCLNVDICFIVDSSASIPLDNWDKVRDSVNASIDLLPVGVDENEVGVVEFSSNAQLELSLSESADKVLAMNKVSHMEFLRAGTYTDKGLSNAREYCLAGGQDRPGIDNKCFLITDGSPKNMDEAMIEADRLRAEKNCMLFTVGIGSGITQAELLKLTDNDLGKVMLHDTFVALKQDMEHVMTKFCHPDQDKNGCKPTSPCQNGGVCLNNMGDFSCECPIGFQGPTCGEAAPAPSVCDLMDFVIILDSSASIPTAEFHYLIQFIQNLVDKFNVSPTTTRVSLVNYSSQRVRTDIRLDATTNKEDFKNVAENTEQLREGTYTHLGFEYAQNDAFTAAKGARLSDQNVKRKALLITDGVATHGTNATVAAASLRNTQTEVYAVGCNAASEADLLNYVGNDAGRYKFTSEFATLSTPAFIDSAYNMLCN